MSIVERAERATIGAILLRPEQLRAFDNWLTSRDFEHPKAAAGYRLLCRMQDMDEINPRTFLAAAGRSNDLVATSIDGPYIHQLLQAPPDENSAVVYGRLVLEASIHRQLAAAMIRIDQVTAVDGDPVEVLHETLDELARVNDTTAQLDGAWHLAGGTTTGAGSTLWAPPEAAEQTTAAEHQLLASLLRHPHELPAIRRFLQPEHFNDAHSRAVYESMLTAHGRGEPVDVLTVAWQAERRAPVGALTAELLDELVSQADPGSSAVLAQRLAAGAVLGRVRAAASALQGLTEYPSPTPEMMLPLAQRLLRGTERDMFTIRDALKPTPPPARTNDGEHHAAARL